MRNVFLETTVRTLKQNKTRAVVTLIGVIVSVAMITSIILLAYSTRDYLIRDVRSTSGNWGIGIKNISSVVKEEADKQNLSYGEVQSVGYSYLKGSKNSQKPFMYLINMNDKMEDISNIQILDGRMPNNSREIVIPQHLNDDSGINYKVGDTLKVNIGVRIGVSTGEELDQITDYSAQDEVFIPNRIQSFKVVGICKRVSIEPYMAAGYTAITKDVKPVMNQTITYFSDSDYEKVKSIVDRYYTDSSKIRYNDNLLYNTGAVGGMASHSNLYAITTVLLVLTFVGACILLYNTFSISNRERKSQYEIMASVGATENQLRRTALYEGGFLAVVGIPIGIFLGTVGTYLILNVFGDKIESLINKDVSINLELVMNGKLILIAAILSFIVLQAGIFIPAYKAGKTKPIEEYDYDVLSGREQKKVLKQSRIMYRLFGGEGLLASKNYKRNVRQYRSTIISLVMSIVLFVSANGLTLYVQNGMDAMLGLEGDYDIAYQDDDATKAEEAYYTFKNIEGVTSQAFVKEAVITSQIGETPYTYMMFIIDDKTFSNFLAQFDDIDTDEYLDSNNPKAIGVTHVMVYDKKTNRLSKKEIFNENNRIDQIKEIISGEKINLNVGTYVDKSPEEIFATVNRPTVIMSKSASKNIVNKVQNKAFSGRAIFKSQNNDETYKAIEQVCEEKGYDKDKLDNLQQKREDAQSTLTLLKVFSYGFILLMAIVAIANVFNTVSANFELRRMEFATLRALGMTNGEFRRMLYFECLIMTAKTLIYGIPLAIIGLFIVFKMVRISVITGYILPLGSIILSVVCVFAVMIVVILYAISKLNDEDPAAVLKKNIY